MNEDFENVLFALFAAQNHLDYCGYGDNYERDCARSDKLPELIDQIIEKMRKNYPDLCKKIDNRFKTSLPLTMR